MLYCTAANNLVPAWHPRIIKSVTEHTSASFLANDRAKKTTSAKKRRLDRWCECCGIPMVSSEYVSSQSAQVEG